MSRMNVLALLCVPVLCHGMFKGGGGDCLPTLREEAERLRQYFSGSIQNEHLEQLRARKGKPEKHMFSPVLPVCPSRLNRIYPFQNKWDTIGKRRIAKGNVFTDKDIVNILVRASVEPAGTSPQKHLEGIKIRGFHGAYTQYLSEPATQHFRKAMYRVGQEECWYGHDEEGHFVFQQPSRKACAVSCAGMLLLDRQVQLPDNFAEDVVEHEDCDALKIWNDYGYQGVCEDPESEGPFAPPHGDMFSLLQSRLRTFGSILLSIYIDDVIPGHMIILDGISADRKTVVVCDPYHGWIIWIKNEALTSKSIKRLMSMQEDISPVL